MFIHTWLSLYVRMTDGTNQKKCCEFTTKLMCSFGTLVFFHLLSIKFFKSQNGFSLKLSAPLCHLRFIAFECPEKARDMISIERWKKLYTNVINNWKWHQQLCSALQNFLYRNGNELDDTWLAILANAKQTSDTPAFLLHAGS